MSPSYPSPAALRRALRREVWGEPRRFRATCALGLERFLRDEVQRLPGVRESHERPGEVVFEAAFEAVYAALLGLRTADTLRVSLGEMPAGTFPMLFDHLQRRRWPAFLPQRCELSVRVRSRKSRLRDPEGLERTLRKVVREHGIEDRAREGPSLGLALELWRDRAEVWLDAAGAPLHRRRGEKWTSPTTLRETTAAAACLLAGVRDADLVVDPFCGSGTLLQEAAELMLGICPGGRRPYALEGSPCFKPERMRHAWRRDCAQDRSASEGTPALLGVDVDEQAVRAARTNLKRAGLAEHVSVDRRDARTLQLARLAAEAGSKAPVLLANPPYGRRARAVGGPPAALLAEVLSSASGWRFALVYPERDHLAGSPGVQLDEVVPVRMRGLRTNLITGRVDAS